MNTTAIGASLRSRSATLVRSRVRDFAELTKPRLSMMVLVTVAVAMLVCGVSVSIATLLGVVASTGLVAASASIANQIIERDVDRRMQRTIDRPIPDGRVSVADASFLAMATLALGCVGLVLCGGGWTCVLGLATWFVYIAIYTPLKRRSAWNTFFGAIAGALPVLIGWSATDDPLTQSSLFKASIIFVILFAWQFPHFMAIAWRYREDYAAASLKMASVTEPTGWLSGWIAIAGAATLIPVGAALAFVGDPAPLYLVLTSVLGLWQLVVAWWFAYRRDASAARMLLRTSLIYLPLFLLCATLLPIM